MIRKGTILKISDNSGGKLARCIAFYRNRESAVIGDVILVSVFELSSKSGANCALKKGSVHKAIILRTRQKIHRNGVYFSFNDNAVTIVDNNLKPYGNRILGETLRLHAWRFSAHKNILNLIEKAY